MCGRDGASSQPGRPARVRDAELGREEPSRLETTWPMKGDVAPHGLLGSQVRVPPPLCVTGAAPNGSLRRPACVPSGLTDWLRWDGPPGAKPLLPERSRGRPEGGWLPSNGAVARRVPGLESARSREAAAHPPWAPERCSPQPLSPPWGSRKPPSACFQENTVSAVGGLEQALAPLPDPRKGPAPPSPRLCAGRRRPLCPGGEWRTWQSPTATSRAFGEFKGNQRRLWGVPGLQPPGKARGRPFRSQVSDSRQSPLPCVPL